MLSIHIQNYYHGKIIFDNDLSITTKGDIRYHGFGTKSIKMIVEKYKGTLSFNIIKDIFSLNILFPIQS